jgi:hypothetical protein
MAEQGTGIAGASDYAPATAQAEKVCWVCGGPLDRPGVVGRIILGPGIVEACGKVCAADPKFASP